MTRDFQFYHGVVLSQLVHGIPGGTSIRVFDESSNSSYIIGSEIGIYVKYSSNRLTPWRFTFSPEHRQEIEALRASNQTSFVVLVCNDDGVACLTFQEWYVLCQHPGNSTGWVSVDRHKGQKYAVKGSNGITLPSKIGKSDFPRRLLE